MSFQEIFDNIIFPLCKQLDAYKLVQYSIEVCQTLQDKSQLVVLKKLDELLKELSSTTNTANLTIDVSTHYVDATLLLHSIIAYYLLVNNNDLFGAVELVNQVQQKMDNVTTIILNPLTHYTYHSTYAFIEHKRQNYLREFSHKLMMLSYMPEAVEGNMTQVDRQQIATDICLSALLSPNIYNFGEVLTHNAVQVYTPQYLKELLVICQKGDLSNVKAYFATLQQHLATATGADKALMTTIASKYAFLYRKLQVVALINDVFSRTAEQRKVPYQQLYKVLALNHADDIKNVVELEQIVTYAIGCGVIKAQINNIESTVLFTWVQPRLLDATQLGSLKNAVEQSVTATTKMIDVFVSALKEKEAELVQ